MQTAPPTSASQTFIQRIGNAYGTVRENKRQLGAWVATHPTLAAACVVYAMFVWPLVLLAGATLVLLGFSIVVCSSVLTAAFSPVLAVALQSMLAAWGVSFAVTYVGKRTASGWRRLTKPAVQEEPATTAAAPAEPAAPVTAAIPAIPASAAMPANAAVPAVPAEMGAAVETAALSTTAADQAQEDQVEHN